MTSYRNSVILGKLHYEAQTSRRDGKYYLVISLTRGEHTWTSPPALLEAAESFDEANKLAVEQVTALHRALRSE